VAIEPVPGTVGIVGAGPAGLIAAERLAASGAAVTLYDRMLSPGRKFLFAGRGGLNLTHSEGLNALLDRYGPARARLAPSITAFPPDALRAWAAGLGEEVFVGSSGRVFPRSFKATPLLRAWLARLRALGVTFCPGHRWLGWSEDGALLFRSGSGQHRTRPDVTLLALGGASWSRLGSDGAWAEILRARGVSVSRLRPANCGFLHEWSPVFRARFEGQPLKRIAAGFGERWVRGEAIITADGIEGGVVYALSAPLRDVIERDGEATLALDLRPDLDAEALARRMGGAGVSRANALRRAGLSQAAAGLVRELAGEPKRLELRLAGTRPIERAISTAGGVALDDVDERLMLRAMPGVFVAGEMLDWEAPTGGYLLQACFSTGWHAAAGMLAWLAADQAAGSP